MFQRTELWLRKSNLSMLLITLGGNNDFWTSFGNEDSRRTRTYLRSVACQNGPNLWMGVNKQNLSPASKLFYWLMDKTGEIILLHCRDKIRSVLQAKVRVMAILYKLDLLRSTAGPHFFPFNIFSAMMWQKSCSHDRKVYWKCLLPQHLGIDLIGGVGL